MQLKKRTFPNGKSKHIVIKDGVTYDMLTDLDTIRSVKDEWTDRCVFRIEDVEDKHGEVFETKYCYVMTWEDKEVEL